MLYHASKENGLNELMPCASTHGKAYVYAARSRITAACFGAPKDDFDLLMDETDGIPHLYECYPRAIETVYRGKSCTLYEVGEEGFHAGETGWDAELVCDRRVPVIGEEYIPDLLLFLRRAAAQGRCVFHAYSEEPQYQAMLCEELGERIRRSGIAAAEMQQDPRRGAFCRTAVFRACMGCFCK